MTRTQLLHNAATCDEQDAWTDETVAYGWLVPTREDGDNVLCFRELTRGGAADVTVGYVLH